MTELLKTAKYSVYTPGPSNPIGELSTILSKDEDDAGVPQHNNQPTTSTMSLGDRMKFYESAELDMVDGAYVLPLDGRPIIARIDGHTFSSFTRGFEKPFDERLAHAMTQTTCDLVEKFQACTGYTQSDEITLVFIPIKDDKGGFREWSFRGRVVKLATLLASYAGVRFNHHLIKAVQASKYPYSESVLKRVSNHEAHFDARIFAVPNEHEVYNNVYWRMAYDCARNSAHNLARCHFSEKQLRSKNRDEQKAMLLEKGVDYNDMPPAFKFGVFVKKEMVLVDAVDPNTGESLKAARARMRTFSVPKFDVDFVVSSRLPIVS